MLSQDWSHVMLDSKILASKNARGVRVVTAESLGQIQSRFRKAGSTTATSTVLFPVKPLPTTVCSPKCGSDHLIDSKFIRDARRAMSTRARLCRPRRYENGVAGHLDRKYY